MWYKITEINKNYQLTWKQIVNQIYACALVLDEWEFLTCKGECKQRNMLSKHLEQGKNCKTMFNAYRHFLGSKAHILWKGKGACKTVFVEGKQRKYIGGKRMLLYLQMKCYNAMRLATVNAVRKST